jgi:hypothetical protein
MKAKLEFDLDEWPDKKAHKRAVSATDAYLALHDIDNKLREYVKYEKGIDAGSTWNLPLGSHELTESEACLMWHLAQKIRTEINCILSERGVNLDDLE